MRPKNPLKNAYIFCRYCNIQSATVALSKHRLHFFPSLYLSLSNKYRPMDFYQCIIVQQDFDIVTSLLNGQLNKAYKNRDLCLVNSCKQCQLTWENVGSIPNRQKTKSRAMMNHSGLVANHWEQNYALCNLNVNMGSSATFISTLIKWKNNKKNKATLGGYA